MTFLKKCFAINRIALVVLGLVCCWVLTSTTAIAADADSDGVADSDFNGDGVIDTKDFSIQTDLQARKFLCCHTLSNFLSSGGSEKMVKKLCPDLSSVHLTGVAFTAQASMYYDDECKDASRPMSDSLLERLFDGINGGGSVYDHVKKN